MFRFVTETVNILVGCTHGCIYCWARRQARRNKNNCPRCAWFYPHIHKERLNHKFKPGTIVFVSDLGDLFCGATSSSDIMLILKVIRENPETTFFLETKNPIRMCLFKDEIPENVVLSTTIETDKEFGELPKIGGWRYEEISKAPSPGQRKYWFSHPLLRDFKKHVSIEPILDFNLETFTKWIIDINPTFGISIGYDNYKNYLPEPPLEKTQLLIDTLQSFGYKIEKKTIRKAWWQD